MTNQKHYPMPEPSEHRKHDGGLSEWIEIMETSGPSREDTELICLLLELRHRRESESPKPDPVTFDSLRDTVAEVTGGLPHQWGEGHKGHESVPFMNFNSLMRLVKSYQTAAPEVK